MSFKENVKGRATSIRTMDNLSFIDTYFVGPFMVLAIGFLTIPTFLFGFGSTSFANDENTFWFAMAVIVPFVIYWVAWIVSNYLWAKFSVARKIAGLRGCFEGVAGGSDCKDFTLTEKPTQSVTRRSYEWYKEMVAIMPQGYLSARQCKWTGAENCYYRGSGYATVMIVASGIMFFIALAFAIAHLVVNWVQCDTGVCEHGLARKMAIFYIFTFFFVVTLTLWNMFVAIWRVVVGKETYRLTRIGDTRSLPELRGRIIKKLKDLKPLTAEETDARPHIVEELEKAKMTEANPKIVAEYEKELKILRQVIAPEDLPSPPPFEVGSTEERGGMTKASGRGGSHRNSKFSYGKNSDYYSLSNPPMGKPSSGKYEPVVRTSVGKSSTTSSRSKKNDRDLLGY